MVVHYYFLASQHFPPRIPVWESIICGTNVLVIFASLQQKTWQNQPEVRKFQSILVRKAWRNSSGHGGGRCGSVCSHHSRPGSTKCHSNQEHAIILKGLPSVTSFFQLAPSPKGPTKVIPFAGDQAFKQCICGNASILNCNRMLLSGLNEKIWWTTHM